MGQTGPFIYLTCPGTYTLIGVERFARVGWRMMVGKVGSDGAQEMMAVPGSIVVSSYSTTIRLRGPCARPTGFFSIIFFFFVYICLHLRCKWTGADRSYPLASGLGGQTRLGWAGLGWAGPDFLDAKNIGCSKEMLISNTTDILHSVVPQMQSAWVVGCFTALVSRSSIRLGQGRPRWGFEARRCGEGKLNLLDDRLVLVRQSQHKSSLTIPFCKRGYPLVQYVFDSRAQIGRAHV